MKKISLVTRILALVMALSMVFMMTAVNAFAEGDETATTGKVPEGSAKSSGDLITFGTLVFTNSGTITLNLSKAYWFVTISGVITGNAGAQYEVVMTTPSGSSVTTYMTSSSGTFSLITTLAYASAGTYKFKFTRLTGSASPCSAIAEIRD